MRSANSIFLNLLALLTHLVPMFYISLQLGEVSPSLFGENIFNVMQKYRSVVSTAEWCYYVYIPMWVWQAVWIVYGICGDCRKATNGKYVSEYDVIPNDVFVCYCLANIMLTVWMQLFTRQRIIFSSVAIIFVFALSVIGLVRTCRYLKINLDKFLKVGLSTDIMFVRIFLQNGLACYAVFMCQIMLENVVASLFVGYDVTDTTVSYLSSATLAFAILVLFWIDIIFCDLYIRYIIAPYAFYLYILAGLFAQNFDLRNNIGTSMFLICVASCASFVLMTKIFLTIYRHVKTPLSNECTYEAAATAEGE